MKQRNWDLVAEYVVSGQDYFYRLAYSQVRDRETALDIVQESVAKALARADSLREPACLRTWFYRILINECMDHFRRRKNLVPLEDWMDIEVCQHFQVEESVDLYQALERLDERERMVIQLRFFEDMKLAEIAEVTDTNLNTVKTRLYSGLRKLKGMTEEGEWKDEGKHQTR